MKAIRSGWCETGHCNRCPSLLQAADGRRREIRCDCPCHAPQSVTPVTDVSGVRP